MILTLFSCGKPKIELKNTAAIPAPVSHHFKKDYFTINKEIVISNGDDFTQSVDSLKAHLENRTGRKWEIKYATQNVISFEYDGAITSKESYTLEINENQILIKASAEAGAFNAVQSLLKLMIPLMGTETIHIPVTSIKE